MSQFYSELILRKIYLENVLLSLLVRLTEQWKPINPEEKKQYDREFLLGFQFISASMNKPEGLPAISDVVLDKVQPLTLKTRPYFFGYHRSTDRM